MKFSIDDTINIEDISAKLKLPLVNSFMNLRLEPSAALRFRGLAQVQAICAAAQWTGATLPLAQLLKTDGLTMDRKWLKRAI